MAAGAQHFTGSLAKIGSFVIELRFQCRPEYLVCYAGHLILVNRCASGVSFVKVGTWLATTAFAVALSFTCVTQSVLAVTNEQLLFLEVSSLLWQSTKPLMFKLLCNITEAVACHVETRKNIIVLQAWRAVDRAYYDKNFNGKSWFRVSLLSSTEFADSPLP